MTSLDTKTDWLGIQLKNPIVLGSQTPFSHKRINEQVEHYLRAISSGVGAVVLESAIPSEFGREDIVFTQHDLCPITTGLEDSKSSYMTFSILGPPIPNLSSITYGRQLAKALREKTNTPIIGSIITNFEQGDEIVNAARSLMEAGVDALELNSSCPNVVLFKEKSKTSPTFEIIKEIKQVTGLKVSLKVVPQFPLQSLIDHQIINIIDGLTYANAYLGLVPPNLTPPFANPFGRGDDWCYTGIYGPFERLLTYKNIAAIAKNSDFSSIDLAATGGFVDERHAIEALLLGADVVQLSSGISWKGLDFVSKTIRFLETFMKEQKFSTVEEFRGKSLSYIQKGSAEVDFYKAKPEQESPKQRAKVEITDRCIQCGKCLNKGCLALKRSESGKIFVDSDLCSGCGWCEIMCPIKGAIKRK